MKHFVKTFLIAAILAGMLFSVPFKAHAGISNKKAFFLSLLIPGLGEAYVGNTGYAKSFFTSELILWASWFTLDRYYDINVNHYSSFAALHSGLNPAGKGDTLRRNLGNYQTSLLYNKSAFIDYGPEAQYYQDSEEWSWDNSENRRKYRKMMEDAQSIDRKTIMFLGALLGNHLLSAINANRLAHKKMEGNITSSFKPSGDCMIFTLTKKF